MNKNTGIDWAREEREMTDKDYIFGVKKLKGLADDFDPEPYLPTGELQKGREDAMDCSPRSAHNDLETQFNYLIRNGILSVQNIKWLSDNGYMDENGSIALSDRFTAILSGTTRQGNSLRAPHESIRKNGCIPKSMLPAPPNFTWVEYHRKSDIIQAMIDLGKEFKRRFPTNWERAYSEHYHRMKGVIGVAGYAWPQPVNGVYPRTNTPPNHAYIIYKDPNPFKAFDNYLDRGIKDDWIKQLATNYKFYPHGYKLTLNEFIPEDNSKKKLIMLKRLKDGEKVFVCIGKKKYWLVAWSVLDDFKEVFGYETLAQAQQSVVEVDKSVLDGYEDGGILGNLSLLDFIFGKGQTK